MLEAKEGTKEEGHSSRGWTEEGGGAHSHGRGQRESQIAG